MEALEEYADLERSVRRTWARMDTLAAQAVQDKLGWEVPQTFTYTAENGDRYAVNVRATVTLLERAIPKEE